MRAVWQAFRSDLMQSIDTLGARRQFEAVKQDRPQLQRFADVASILDYLHVRSILRRAREERARLVELPDHEDQHEGRHGGDPPMAAMRGRRRSRDRDATLIRALARAHRWKRMLEEGTYRSTAEIAEAEGMTRSFVGQP